MRKRISAAALTLAVSGSVLVAPLAFATEEEPAASAVAANASAAAELGYGNNNELEIPWNSTQEFKINGTLPQNASFAVPTEKVDGWDYSVDKKTGTLTITSKENRPAGSTLTLPVRVRTTRGYSQFDVTVTVVKGETSLSDQATVEYPSDFIKIAPGESATVKPSITGDLPSGTKFIMNEKNSDNWTFAINDKGVITATLPKDAQPGRTWKMGVIVVFPDGSQQDLKVPFEAA